MAGAPVPQAKETGRSFDFPGTSRFEILSVLGEGAVGVVYEAFDRERNERVALKTLRTSRGETLRLLKNEFRSVQDLSHPNLVELGEMFEDEGRWFFTMELVQGEDFVRSVRPGGRLDAARLRQALVQLARGLAALHAADKVHRDVKPSNVLVTPEGRVVILDFGVVQELDRARLAEDEGGIIGTAAYMSPEQVAAEAVGPASDLYAVGAILYEALTGRLPFTGTLDEVLTAKLQREPPPPSRIVAGLPPDLEQLSVDLLRLEPASRPTMLDFLRRLDASVDSQLVAVHAPFTGRRAELQALRAAFDDSLDHAVAVVVAGESGAGKTRLARAFAESALSQDRKTLVLRGRCFERESVPFKGVDGMIDDLGAYLGGLPEGAAEALLPPHPTLLTRVFPVLAQVPAFAWSRPSVHYDLVPDEMRRLVFVGIRALLTAVARQRRLVLVLDDLQWADADTLALLRTLLLPPEAPRLLLLATLRTSEGAVPPELPGDVRPMPLGALAPDDARALARRLLGAAAPAESVDALVSESKGHPLFLDELVRQGPVHGSRSAPVVRLDDALWARVCGLPPEARDVMELLALSGLPVAPSILAGAAAMPRAQVNRVVWTLRSSRLARLEEGVANARVAPYHDRVRESVLAHLGADERRQKHERLAHALESAGHDNAEELATHWEGAGRPDRAAEYALKAADAAARALAFEQAARLYRRALRMRDFSPAESIAIERRCAEALGNAGRLADSARMHLEIAEREPTLAALDLRRKAAEQFLVGGHFDEGNRIMKQVVSELGLWFPPSPLFALVSFLWHRLLLRIRGLRFTERAASSEDALEMMRLDVASSAGQGFLMTDNIRGVYFLMLSLRGALAAGEPLRLMRATTFEALAAGAPDRAWTRRLLGIAHALAERLMTPYAQAVLAYTDGATGYFWGEWKRGGEALARGERLLRERCVGVAFELNTVRLYLLRVLSYLGRVREMMELVPPLVREAEHREDRYSIINLRAVGGYFVALAADDPARALQEVELAESHLGHDRYTIQHYICLYARSQVDLYAGRPADALGRVEASWKRIQRAMLLRVEIIRVQLLDLAARAAIAAPATPEQRARNLRRAEQWADALARELPPWAHALATLLRGCIAAARGDEEAARGQIERAAELLRAADMPLHAAAAERRLAQLVGGEAGATRRARADAAMREHGLTAPDRWMELLAPVGSTRKA